MLSIMEGFTDSVKRYYNTAADHVMRNKGKYLAGLGGLAGLGAAATAWHYFGPDGAYGVAPKEGPSIDIGIPDKNGSITVKTIPLSQNLDASKIAHLKDKLDSNWFKPDGSLNADYIAKEVNYIPKHYPNGTKMEALRLLGLVK